MAGSWQLDRQTVQERCLARSRRISPTYLGDRWPCVVTAPFRPALFDGRRCLRRCGGRTCGGIKEVTGFDLIEATARAR